MREVIVGILEWKKDRHGDWLVEVKFNDGSIGWFTEEEYNNTEKKIKEVKNMSEKCNKCGNELAFEKEYEKNDFAHFQYYCKKCDRTKTYQVCQNCENEESWWDDE